MKEAKRIDSKNNLQLSFYFIEGVKVEKKEAWWEKPGVKSEFHEADTLHFRPIIKPNIIH